ncbi:PleD family two-component system response regulator [Ferruginibacter sp. HRS2-29]|uniref:response regulator n=1 Tax=Ferruginibacter sp. HRS2-29 TaxID=2487334 RepID=UPI0020CF77EB|nr:response regulator [Ferruginibacter sp. HRS2-29]MCP9750557.1 response regulator [Ferruginibacter sp. HRS2-29]
MNNDPAHIKILAVDDEPDLLMLLSVSLRTKGYTVFTSLNGNHLLDSIHENKPDVIFMDLSMKNLNGADLCVQLKHNKTTASIPIILLSGNDDVIYVSRHCGASGFVYKPFETAKVILELNRVLDEI